MNENQSSQYHHKSSRDVFGMVFIDLAEADQRIVAITADVPESVRMAVFRERWPERFFDFGLAEQNMMSAAAGFARCGKIPYVSTYAIFSSFRAAEQCRTDVAYGDLPVHICASHSGISLGPAGPSHHVLEDISLYRSLANMTVIVPADGVGTAMALHGTKDLPGPVYIRLSRAAEPLVYQTEMEFTIGKAQILREGNDIALIACGSSVGRSMQAAESLAEQGIESYVVDMASIKPIDRQAIEALAKGTQAMLTIEEHSIIGGLGSAVAEVLAEAGISTSFKRLGIPDEFTLAGSYPDLVAHYSLDEVGITKAAKYLLMN